VVSILRRHLARLAIGWLAIYCWPAALSLAPGCCAAQPAPATGQHACCSRTAGTNLCRLHVRGATTCQCVVNGTGSQNADRYVSVWVINGIPARPQLAAADSVRSPLVVRARPHFGSVFVSIDSPPPRG